MSKFNLKEIHKDKIVGKKSDLFKYKKGRKFYSNKDDDDFMLIIPSWLHRELDEESRKEQLWKELYD